MCGLECVVRRAAAAGCGHFKASLSYLCSQILALSCSPHNRSTNRDPKVILSESELLTISRICLISVSLSLKVSPIRSTYKVNTN